MGADSPNTDWKFPRNRILVDFDGTLGPFRWPKMPDKPFPGVVDAIKELKSLGFQIVIFTTRAWPGWIDIDGHEFYVKQLEDVRDCLERWSVPYDGITHEKLPCMFIIDDRSLNPDLISWERIMQIIRDSDSDSYGKVRGAK